MSMGYNDSMGYGMQISASQVGRRVALWDIRNSLFIMGCQEDGLRAVRPLLIYFNTKFWVFHVYQNDCRVVWHGQNIHWRKVIRDEACVTWTINMTICSSFRKWGCILHVPFCPCRRTSRRTTADGNHTGGVDCRSRLIQVDEFEKVR